MRAKVLGKTFNSKELNAQLRSLRELRNDVNLRYLALDYLTLAAIVSATVGFFLSREGWGIAWLWNVPVALVAITLVGAVQHRLAGLGHEAAHYILFSNRFWNELVSDLFCMFPIFATTHQYRLVHLAHHQYTNDWERDPDLLNIGYSKLMDRFPMTRWRFIFNYFFRFFLPHVLLRYLWDIVYLSAFGRGASPYLHEGRLARRAGEQKGSLRLTSLLGVAYFFGMVAMLATINRGDHPALLALAPVACLLVAIAVVATLPDRAFFHSPLKPEYSAKTTAALRLVYYTAMLSAFAWLRRWTGVNFGAYYLVLWVTPLLTSFAYFMLLRDVYQHANADDGKLTNSRVFFSDPLTRWAVFVYGMDIHIPHHMYPAIPHYNLLKAHEILKEHSAEYAEHVVECEGTFRNRSGRPTILDVMQRPTKEPAPATSNPPIIRSRAG